MRKAYCFIPDLPHGDGKSGDAMSLPHPGERIQRRKTPSVRHPQRVWPKTFLTVAPDGFREWEVRATGTDGLPLLAEGHLISLSLGVGGRGSPLGHKLLQLPGDAFNTGPVLAGADERATPGQGSLGHT